MQANENADHPLKLWRQRQSPPLSQEEFGALVERTAATISRWESRERDPDLDDIAKVEVATGGQVTRDDFMPPLPGSAARTERVVA